MIPAPNLGVMNVAALVREVLADHKAAGVGFEVAWARAWTFVRGRSLQARQWQVALEWAKPAFESAYTGDGESSIALAESALVG